MITKDIAQRIVDRMIDIINYNVNIMDKDAIIIASGDRDRIGTLHQGAKEALGEKECIEVYEDKTGTKRGVNIPIKFNNRNIGVIGITGDPKIVRPFGELVKVTAELLIQQEYSIEKYIIKNKLKEEYLYEWLYRKEIYDNEFIDRGLELNIRILDEGYLMIIDHEKDENKKVKKIIDFYLKDIGQVVILNANRLCLILENDISKIKAFIKELNKIDEDNIYRILYMRRDELLSDTFFKVIGTVNIINRLKVERKTLKDDQINFYSKLENTINKKDGEYIISKIKDGGEELLETFLIYMENNNEKIKTANKLHIHRNTLIYRLSKIEDLTGLKFHDNINFYRFMNTYFYFTICKVTKNNMN